MIRSLLLALLLFGCAAAEEIADPAPVAAPQPHSSCAPRPLMLAVLSDHYGEAPVAGGMTRQGVVMEILTAEGGRTFTILYSSFSTGVSCVVHHGEGWRFLPAPQEGEAS
jgi:hypothetical protein